MPREPRVRNKNGHWFSESGGVGRYFGRCDSVTQTQAMARLYAALAEDGGGGDKSVEIGQDDNAHACDLRTNEQTRPAGRRRHAPGVRSFVRNPMTTNAAASSPHPTPPTLSTINVHELADLFLAWVRTHRGETAYKNRQRHLRRFRKVYGEMEVVAIKGAHIEAFTDTLRSEGHAVDYIQKHLISVGAMFNKGARKGWLPTGVKPFATVEALRLPAKTLTEDALPTNDEIHALLTAADADPHGQMGDLLRLYYDTGARTHELIRAKVGDFQRQARTIVLGHHKRSHTMREPTARTITLNAEAYAILERRCESRGPDLPIFYRPKTGKPMGRPDANQYFRTVRKRAAVRDSITIYSFRHLWISEMLMAGVDVLLVARMAGTSVAMIERVYGHFRNQSYQEAQARLDRVRGSRGL
jgi:integrase